MIYGNISRPSKRRLRRNSFGTDSGSAATSAGGRASEIRSTRFSESFFTQPRASANLALPTYEEEDKDEGFFKELQDWFVGENWMETFYLNSPWMLRFLHFLYDRNRIL